MAKKTLCDFADITSASTCGESIAGIATTIYIGFKNDLESMPKFKESEEGDEDMSAFASVDDTTGFEFVTGKCFHKWEIDTDSGQLTSTSVAQQKGFTNQLVFKIAEMTPQISALLRVLNNRKDAFIAIPEGDKYKMIYNPDRNIKIDSGGISYDSGTTPDSESGTTVTISVPAPAPVIYYAGEVSTTPAVGG